MCLKEGSWQKINHDVSVKAGNWEDVGQLLWIPVIDPKSLAIILKAVVK